MQAGVQAGVVGTSAVGERNMWAGSLIECYGTPLGPVLGHYTLVGVYSGTLAGRTPGRRTLAAACCVQLVDKEKHGLVGIVGTAWFGAVLGDLAAGAVVLVG